MKRVNYLTVFFLFAAGLFISLSLNKVEAIANYKQVEVDGQTLPSDRSWFRSLPEYSESSSTIDYTAMNQINKFPLGAYDRIDKPEHPSQIREMGFDWVMPYTNPYAKGDYDTIRTYLDAANRAGLKVLLEPFRESVKQQKFAEVTDFVNTFKNHPAVFGWYAYDEPNLHKVSPQIINSLYKTIRAADPNHPIIVNFSGSRGEGISDYRNSFDIATINRYPLTKYEDGTSKDGLRILRSFHRKISESANDVGNYPFWLVTQAFESKKWRLPNLIEQKYMLYTGITGGAEGVFFYAFHRAPNEWKQDTIKPLLAEVKGYLSAFERGELNKKVQSNKPKVEASLYPDGDGKYLLIAINHSDENMSSQFIFQGNVSPNSLRLVGKEEASYLNGNSFIDAFKPYEVKIYSVEE